MWRAGCCLLLRVAVGCQRRVSRWHLGSLWAEPPLICRRMCFNRKVNPVRTCARSLLPGPGGGTARPGSELLCKRRAPGAPRGARGGSAALAAPSISAPGSAPLLVRLFVCLVFVRSSPARSQRISELCQNSAFQPKCWLTSRAQAGSPAQVWGPRAAAGGSAQGQPTLRAPLCQGTPDPSGSAGNSKSRLKNPKERDLRHAFHKLTDWFCVSASLAFVCKSGHLSGILGMERNVEAPGRRVAVAVMG